MLLPQQLQRHARPAKLAMDRRPVRLRPPVLRAGLRRRVQNRAPAPRRSDPRAAASSTPARRARRMQSPAAVAPIDKLAAILRLDMPPARSLSTSRILRMGNLCPGMPRSLSKGARQCRFADHPTDAVTPPLHRLVAIARNRWSRSIGTPGRNQSEQLVAISRCAQPGRGRAQPPVRAQSDRLRSLALRAGAGAEARRPAQRRALQGLAAARPRWSACGAS